MSHATPRIIPIQPVSPAPENEMDAGPVLSPAEEWNEDRKALDRLSRNREWEEALKILKRLSTKHKNHQIYTALAQRIWVGLKTTTPAVEVVQSLFHLLNTFGPRHELAPDICALAHLLAKHRTPDHPDRDLAIGQSQQMFSLVCDSLNVVGEEAFQIWVAANRLDQPDHYTGKVLKALEIMVGEEWWIDREALQRDLEQNQTNA